MVYLCTSSSRVYFYALKCPEQQIIVGWGRSSPLWRASGVHFSKFPLRCISCSPLHNPPVHAAAQRGWSPPGIGTSIPQCTARGASLERDDDGGGRCTRSDHTAGKRCQSFNGENFNLVFSHRGCRQTGLGYLGWIQMSRGGPGCWTWPRFLIKYVQFSLGKHPWAMRGALPRLSPSRQKRKKSAYRGNTSHFPRPSLKPPAPWHTEPPLDTFQSCSVARKLRRFVPQSAVLSAANSKFQRTHRGQFERLGLVV